MWVYTSNSRHAHIRCKKQIREGRGTLIKMDAPQQEAEHIPWNEYIQGCQ